MHSLEEIFGCIERSKKMAITTHQKPDGDALGSCLGLYHFLIQFGYEVTIISPTKWPSFLNWMPHSQSIIDFENEVDRATAILQSTDCLFCLDFNVFSRTKKMEPLLLSLCCEKILIDHHEDPAVDSFTFVQSNPEKSSTCEMVYDFIMSYKKGNPYTMPIMQCLYAGMVTDTGSFRFPNTHASTHQVIVRFLEHGLQHNIIHGNLFDNVLENRIRFLGHILSNRLEVLYEYNTTLIYVTKEDIKRFDIRTGDTESLISVLLIIQDIQLGALVVDREEERKWSFRSKNSFNCSNFAQKHFQGGGHVNAAGGVSKESLSYTILYFKKIINQYKNQLSNT